MLSKTWTLFWGWRKPLEEPGDKKAGHLRMPPRSFHGSFLCASLFLEVSTARIELWGSFIFQASYMNMYCFYNTENIIVLKSNIKTQKSTWFISTLVGKESDTGRAHSFPESLKHRKLDLRRHCQGTWTQSLRAWSLHCADHTKGGRPLCSQVGSDC